MDIRCPISPQSTRFLDRLRNFIRLRGLAYKTEKTYVFWIKCFVGSFEASGCVQPGRGQAGN
ncbi:MULTISPECIES: phage integrase N-terminal SAM-like domain-containing protein [Marinobacter]|uniref:Integron integrase IntIPac n=1 Tax=Marinobacter nauticus TaxID=2743 RepID=A0A833N769_MARNT|nr:Integron integrase IntIPac [Marinobacter nauticus]